MQSAVLGIKSNNSVVSMLPDCLCLPNCTTNPSASFVFNYGFLYDSSLNHVYQHLSSSLPILNIRLSKELHHCSGSSTIIQNAIDRDFFEDWLSNILDSKKVEQVDPSFCKILSPRMVVVSGGKKRVVGNFKGLNKLTIKESFVGPSISVVVPACSKFLYHTKIDLKLGFNNVLVDEKCKSLLSFCYDGAYFRYNVMPLGISSGPFTFDGWAKEFVRVVQQFLNSFYYSSIRLERCVIFA